MSLFERFRSRNEGGVVPESAENAGDVLMSYADSWHKYRQTVDTMFPEEFGADEVARVRATDGKWYFSNNGHVPGYDGDPMTIRRGSLWGNGWQLTYQYQGTRVVGVSELSFRNRKRELVHSVALTEDKQGVVSSDGQPRTPDQVRQLLKRAPKPHPLPTRR